MDGMVIRMKNSTKTIKQLADEIGVSKQAIFKKIDNLGLRSELTKINNQFTVNKKQENLIKKAFSENQSSIEASTKSSTKNNQLTIDREAWYQEQIAYLQEQLKEKNDENKSLQDRLMGLSERVEDNLTAVLQGQLADKMIEAKQLIDKQPTSASSSAETSADEIVVESEVMDQPVSADVFQEAEAKPEDDIKAQRKAEIERLGLNISALCKLGIDMKFIPKQEHYQADDVQTEIVNVCILPWIKKQVQELNRMESECKKGTFLGIRFAPSDEFEWKSAENYKSMQKIERCLIDFMASNTFICLSEPLRQKIVSELRKYKNWRKKRF